MNNKKTGIYGIYCKSSDVYSSLNIFEGKLVGTVLADDNSSVILYKNDYKNTDYIEAYKNSNVVDSKSKFQNSQRKPGNEIKQVLFKSQDNSFINFPIPLFDSENLEEITGFDKTISSYINLSGEATSLLYNNGFEFYLTKLKNGLFLSQIIINQTSVENLKKYLEILPRNLNGFNLDITVNDTETLSGTVLNLSGFYGGNISLTSNTTNMQKYIFDSCERN